MTLVRHAMLRALDPETLYRILRLRNDVFVVEQGIISEPELDGVDLDAGTTQFWLEGIDSAGDAVVLATLRLIRGGPVAHIGRVATAADARGRGLAGALMRAAISACDADGTSEGIEISAQAYLEQWYRGFGFRSVGKPYEEAGIEHVRMVRP